MNNYAVIKTGGKQYLVQSGDIIQVERLPYTLGDSVELTNVLLLSSNGDITVGTPLVEGVSVNAEVTENSRRKKIVVFKYKNKTRYRRKQGHRQEYTELKIIDIAPQIQSKKVNPEDSKSARNRSPQDLKSTGRAADYNTLASQVVEIISASLDGTPAEKSSSTRQANKLLREAGISQNSLKNFVTTIRENLNSSGNDTQNIIDNLSQTIFGLLS